MAHEALRRSLEIHPDSVNGLFNLATLALGNLIPEKSIAVLLFADMSEKKDQEYFSDGLSEELIDILSKVHDLRVPARTSSFYFKGKTSRPIITSRPVTPLNQRVFPR